MKIKLLAAAAAVAGLAALMPAAHAQSIDVSVIGTITPAACVPNLAGGGVIDYGNIPASTLSMTAFNVLPVKTVAMTITCDAATLVGLTAVDNQAASRVSGILVALPIGMSDAVNFGLGTVSGANVGGYAMQITGLNVDGNTSHLLLMSTNGGITWGSGGLGYFPHDTRIMSWGTSSPRAPVPGALISANIDVQTVLNKASELPLTSDVPLAGSATLTLVYL